MAPRTSSLAKLASRSDPRRGRSARWIFLLLLLVAPRWAARPVLAEFTNGTAEARSFQPLRLTLDLGGRERSVRITLELPPGGRVAPALGPITVGSRTHVQVLHVYVPSGTAAGAFTVRGAVIDGARRWPFDTAIRVQANPRLVVVDEEIGFALVRAEETVHRAWRLNNTGNVLLELRTSAQPTSGARITVTPATLTLAPGESGEVEMSARLEQAPDRLVTVPLYLNVDSGLGSLRRRETVGITAEFVPREAGTGPLFAELSGEVLAGAVVARDHRGNAGRMRLEGEILPNLHLVATGTDGTSAPGGSRLGLAQRDYLTVDLDAQRWHAAGGLVAPPAFGFLESSTQGRGGTLAWTGAADLTLTALATREHFGDFSREHAGLQAAQTDPDQSGWVAGVLAQRNHTGPGLPQERWGGFAQTNWQWRGVTGASQLAVAQDLAAARPTVGLEQRLDYRSRDDRSHAALLVQEAPAGFLLDGRSAALRDASAGIGAGEAGRVHLHWGESRQRGGLRTYLQAETEAGLTPTQPDLVELITRSGSLVRTRSAGYEFAPGSSRALLTLSETRRTREARLAAGSDEAYREQVLATDWSTGVSQDRWLLTASLAAGTEENTARRTSFGEAAVSAGGQWHETLQFSAEVRHTGSLGAASAPGSGYRQPGTYLRGALFWTPRPRWRAEAGIDAYQFSHFASRTRSYVVIEVPVAARLALATEVSHDDQRTSLWVAARMHFQAKLPWRPVRGALAGRVHESGGQRPVPGARLDLGGRAGLTDADGRFTLPGRLPGLYPFTWSLPPEYLATPAWPRTVVIRAGRRQELDLAADRLALLSGTVAYTREGAELRPTGSISATDAAGRVFETVAATGDFKLWLPPGEYTVRYSGELSGPLRDHLVANVTIGATGAPAAVQLTAREEPRRMRRTFFEDEAAPVKRPAVP